MEQRQLPFAAFAAKDDRGRGRDVLRVALYRVAPTTPMIFGVRRVVSVEPIFVVSDVTRALAHYEQLGFSTSHHDEGYAFAHRNELTIHLAGPGVDPERVGRGSIYMHVDDADALAEEWRGAGVDFVEPQDFEYGKREGSHEDPDGNLIRFGSPLWR